MSRYALLLVLLAATTGCSEDATVPPAGGSGGGGDGGTDEPGARLPCPPGELLLDDGRCKSPGVPADGCADGFTHDGDAGCVPILPETECGDGEMAVVGETTCRPVAVCQNGKWGDIPVDSSTVYVDASYTGGAGDGSASAPFVTIGEALTAAPDGGMVAVAAGDYDESLSISRPVSLWGKCPADVRLASPLGEAIHITSGASRTELHRIAVTGPYDGILIAGSVVLLEQVYVHDTGRNGITAERLTTALSDLTLRDSLVERATRTGVLVRDSTLLMEQTVVRSTQSSAMGEFGLGVSIEPMIDHSEATIRRSVIRDNREFGITVFGSELAVDASVVQDTLGRPAGGGGTGIAGYQDMFNRRRATFSVVDSVVRNNRMVGIAARDSDFTVERTSVRDTEPEFVLQTWGHGMLAFGGEVLPDALPHMTVRESLVDGAYEMGAAVSGGVLDMESSVIRNVRGAKSDGNFGRGISVEIGIDNLEPSSATLRGVRVQNTRDMGIFVVGATADIDSIYVSDIRSRENDGVFGGGVAFTSEALNTQQPGSGTANRVVIERCQAGGLLVAGAEVVASDVVVRDIAPQADKELFGDGVVVAAFVNSTSLDLSHATLSHNARAGLASFGASVSLASSVLDCNQIDLNGEHLPTAPFEIRDLGDNSCPCSGECKVLSTGLQAPSGLSP